MATRTHPPQYQLNDGLSLPAVGLGTAPLPDDEARELVETGLEAGYRLIDTGAIYGNEAGVGQAINAASVPREEISLLTKIRGRDQGSATTASAAEESLRRLGLDYIDLYLIHWPMPHVDKYLETWEAMIALRERGLVRSIGVSNFLPDHLERLRSSTGVVPAVNQIELHPGYPQSEVRAANEAFGVRTLGYSPLGHGGDLLRHPALARTADELNVTPAQVALRWQVELGAVPLPRTAKPAQQEANLAIFDFTLSSEQVRHLAELPVGRIGWDPADREEM